MDLNYSNKDLEILYSKWKKLGWGVTGNIYPDEIDIEALIAETTIAARYDGRLFQWFRTWVCNYADLINKKRLIRYLNEADTAVLGAVLELAIENGADPNFTIVIIKCKPYEEPQLLFKNVNELPFYINQEINNSHPIYKKWGLYCSEVEFYTDALYTRDFVLNKNRLLALRSVLGANIRAEILYNLNVGTGIAIKKLSKEIGYSYSSVYMEVRALLKNGFLSEKDEGRNHKLFLSTKGDMLANQIINSLFVQ
ncbi:MAG: helix-turn-helix transcriptional regulator [Spirochaetes bacterium]|nr:helix-turn-helix transcriptional regulator [Spirochaetota bacterium]